MAQAYANGTNMNISVIHDNVSQRSFNLGQAPPATS